MTITNPSPSQHPEATPVGSGAVLVEGDTPTGTASHAVPVGATSFAVMAPRSYVGVHVGPAPADTTARIHRPSTCSITGKPKRLTALCVGDDVTIQFSTLAEAYGWLDHCIEIIDQAVLDAEL